MTIKGGARDAGTRHAVLLLLLACLPLLGTLAVAPVLPALQRHFAGVPGVAFLAPFVLTAPALVLAFVAPLAGAAAGRFGRRRVLIASTLLYIVAAPLPLVLQTLPQIIASRLVVGFAEAGVMTTATMLLGDYFEPRRRDRYLGLQVMFNAVAAVTFLTVSGALGNLGWRAPFTLYFAPLILLPFALWLLWEPQAPVEAEQSAAPLPWRALAPVLLLTIGGGMCMNLMAVDLGFVLDGIGVRAPQVLGIVAALNSAAIAAGSLFFGWRGGGRGPGRLVVALILGAAGFVLLSRAESTAACAVAGMLTGLGSGFYLPWLLARANSLVDFRQRGRGVGAWMSSYFIAVVAGPALAVALSGPAGSLQAAMLPFGMLLLVLAVIAGPMLRRR